MHATFQGNQHFNAIILGHQLSVPSDNYTTLRLFNTEGNICCNLHLQIIEYKLYSELSVAHPWALGYCTCVADTDTKSRLLRGTMAAPKHDGSLPNFSHY